MLMYFKSSENVKPEHQWICSIIGPPIFIVCSTWLVEHPSALERILNQKINWHIVIHSTNWIQKYFNVLNLKY